MTKPGIERTENNKGLFVGDLVRDLSGGEKLQKFGDLVAAWVHNLAPLVAHAKDEDIRGGTYRSDMTAVFLLLRVASELGVFHSGNLV